MKPSVILYKALPDDLLHRLQEQASVTRVPGAVDNLIAALSGKVEVNCANPEVAGK